MVSAKHLLVIGGPTASGKTKIAIRLARQFHTAIVSCDSRQFYREMTIGTAKPSLEELGQAPHYFVDSLSIQNTYSVGDFERDALDLLDRLYQEHDVVILTGGSGLYIKALCEGLDEFPEVPVAIRQEIELLYQKEGLEALRQALREADPEYYDVVDRNNPHRLIRALAVFRSSGRPFSSFRTGEPVQRPFHPIYLQLHWPRKELYTRINQRVDQMMDAGLLKEVRRLYPYRHLPALQTVGYAELFDYFDGKSTLDEAVDLIRQNTRRYAKRQLTWARRDGFWKRIRPWEWDLCLDYLRWAMEKQGVIRTLQLQEEPLLNSLFPPVPVPHAFPGIRIGAWEGQHLECAVFVAHLSKSYLLLDLRSSEENRQSPLEKWLLHEAVCQTEDWPVFALLPAHFRELLQEYGFQPATAESLPNRLREMVARLMETQPGTGLFLSRAEINR